MNNLISLARMRLIIPLLFLLLFSPAIALSSGYFEFMDDISGGLDKGNKNGIIHATETALQHKDRFNNIPSNNLHDIETRDRLFKALINIVRTEHEGSDYAKKAIDSLITLGKEDNTVEQFLNGYLITGHDTLIKQHIILHKNSN